MNRYILLEPVEHSLSFSHQLLTQVEVTYMKKQKQIYICTDFQVEVFWAVMLCSVVV